MTKSKPKAVSKKLVNAMLEAASAGDNSEIERLLNDGVDSDVKNEFGKTPLMAAAENDREDVFFTLLAAGADRHRYRFQNLEPVLGYAISGRSRSRLRMVEAVIDDPGFEKASLAGCFPIACRVGSTAIVKRLIDAGANVNGPWEPLISAIERDRPDIVALLIKSGADINTRVAKRPYGENKYAGKTALQYAKALKHEKIVNLLANAGAAAPKQKRRRRGPAAPVAESWQRIDAWLKSNAPKWKPLKRAATSKQIEKAESTIGFKLPDDVRESYRIHNGSDELGLFPKLDEDCSYGLLSLTQVIAEWKVWYELLESGEFEGQRVRAGKGVRRAWWHQRWVPFASNGGGDCFCVDLAPTAAGTEGQIITMNHETGQHKLLAASFRQWLEQFANDLEDSKFQYRKREGLG